MKYTYRLNRELSPTISEVYHERVTVLGLAPPLTKLLLPSLDTGSPPLDLQAFYNDGHETRDEGDGRSVADSHSSHGEYNNRAAAL